MELDNICVLGLLLRDMNKCVLGVSVHTLEWIVSAEKLAKYSEDVSVKRIGLGVACSLIVGHCTDTRIGDTCVNK